MEVFIFISVVLMLVVAFVSLMSRRDKIRKEKENIHRWRMEALADVKKFIERLGSSDQKTEQIVRSILKEDGGFWCFVKDASNEMLSMGEKITRITKELDELKSAPNEPPNADDLINAWEADECKPIPISVFGPLKVYTPEKIKSLIKSMEEYKMNPEGKDEESDEFDSETIEEIAKLTDELTDPSYRDAKLGLSIGWASCPNCKRRISFHQDIDQNYLDHCVCGRYLHMDIKDKMAKVTLVKNV